MPEMRSLASLVVRLQKLTAPYRLGAALRRLDQIASWIESFCQVETELAAAVVRLDPVNLYVDDRPT